MKFCALILLAALAVPANAVPVHIALRGAASVQPDSDGFFTLGSVADLSGGDSPMRTRLAGVLLGRAPLSGETRRLTRGDLALKLRQAGCDPNTQTVLEGATQADVTTVGALLAAPSLPPGNGNIAPGNGNTVPVGAASNAPTVIHRGTAVTIVIQTGALTITAPGVARENGGLGDSIRVHRDGVMTDLTVTVLDSQTVQLEI